MTAGRLATLSLLICVVTLATYSRLLGVPAVRNHPEGYVAAFAIAATVAGLGVALRRRWYGWVALAVAMLLLTLGSYTNFVMARIPDAPTVLRLGEPAPEFTLTDSAGRPTSLADYRGKKPVIVVFYRGYW
jgi:AhpC/TSA family protein